MSGRILKISQHFVTHLQRARNLGYLLSMPPYLDEGRMPDAVVKKRLEALGAPIALKDPVTGKELDESAAAWRQRARVADLAARAGLRNFGAADFTPPVDAPANTACTHCHTRFCNSCGVPEVIGHAEESACFGRFEWGCATCFRAQRRSVGKVRELLRLRCQEIEVDLEDLSPAEQHRQLLAQLLEIQADDDCMVCLWLNGVPLRLPDEGTYAREQRAAGFQS